MERFLKTDSVDLGCGADLMSKSDERWAVCWCECRSESHSVACGHKAVSNFVRLVVGAGRCRDTRSDRHV